MKIYVDGMGGDNSPVEIVKGCVLAVNEYDIGLTIIGTYEIIEKELSKYKYNKSKIEIINATEIIKNDDEPALAIKRKKDSSIVVGMNLVRDNNNAVLISAGNTGALLAGGLLKIGRIKGILRPALAPIIPTKNGPSLLIDAGANTDCKPKQLLQFAIMGSVYMEKVIGIEAPRVGLVNIGTEKNKGNDLTKETFKLLKGSNLNFIGNIETRDIPYGVTDIIVCDGFTGNVILKLIEGLSSFILHSLKENMLSTTKGKMGALLLKSSLKNFKDQFDYSEHGGAPFLGVNGGLIKAHGSSNAYAIKNAIRQGIKYLNQEVNKSISEEIKKIDISEI
ncbi:MAG TPA: phosphate acyltransferase PlsX [Eubacteriaceae bacterium]|nr:phosphate acyltransferase PlsX [Eubacteriaceae bacterium]